MPRVPGCDAVYEVADQWRERCLIGDGSLLWPDLDEPTWTVENLELARGAMAELVARRTMRDIDMIQRFASEPGAARRIIADVSAVWNICPVFPTPKSRKAFVATIARAAEPGAQLALLDQAIDAQIGAAEQSRGHTMYQTGRGWDLEYLLSLCLELERQQIDGWSLPDVRAVATETLERLDFGDSARIMVLHMLFPDDVEPLFKHQDRAFIAESPAFSRFAVDSDELDDILKAIRAGLIEEGASPDFSFYDADFQAQWVPPKPIRSTPLSSSVGEQSADPDGSEHPDSAPANDDLESRTNLPWSTLQEIESLVRAKKQIIFEGPPGSGKTYVARLFARSLAGVELDDETTDRVEIVQFHQSYGYEDFVAGIRPVTSDTGQLTYQNQAGVFLQMCARAQSRPEETFVLIIDEINRGNLSRIFGELLFGLEYRDQTVRLQFPVELDGKLVEHLRIPENLYLIGTMNSTDRSLAMIDYALRRRFYFWRLMPVESGQAPVLRSWLEAQPALGGGERARIHDAFVALNRAIAEALTEDYQIGHSYLMLPNGQLADPAALRQVWNYAIEPLLREYFHTQSNAEPVIEQMRIRFFQEPVVLEVFDSEIDPEA